MKRLSIFFALPFYFISCAAPQIPKISSRPISQYTHSKTIGRLSVAIDPYLEEDRVKEIFGVNLIEKGILPIFIVLENDDHSTFLVEKTNFFLQFFESEVNQLAMGDYQRVPESGTVFAAVAFAAGIAIPASFFITVPLIEYFSDKNYRTVQTLINLELPDKTLAKAQSVQGFIYFRIQSSDENELKRLLLRAKIQRVKSNETIVFCFSISLPKGERE